MKLYPFIALLGIVSCPPLIAPASAQEFPPLVNRYPFDEGSGETIHDVVGGKDGVVRGNGADWGPGTLIIPGGASNSAAYGDLPNGLLSSNAEANGGTGEFTIEGWAKVTGTPAWGRIFDFGSTEPGGDAGELDDVGGGGAGLDYFMISATIGADPNNRRLEIRNEDPAGGGVVTADWGIANFDTLFHFVATWDETSGDVRVFEDGELVTETNTPILMSDINDVNNWLGRSNWTGDQTAAMEFEELRIYSGVMNDEAVVASRDAGPDSPPGADPDPDEDGIPTFYEDQFDFLDPNNPDDAALDQDGDGLSNLGEFENATNPEVADTDGDGVSDGAEVNRLVDGSPAPTNPRDADSDDDLLSDGDEATRGTDPLDEDTDGDLFDDGYEVAGGTDPLDPASKPSVAFPPLINRYSFNEGEGIQLLDSVSGQNGEIIGEGSEWLEGKLSFPGGPMTAAAYGDLPNGLLSRHGAANGGTGEVTFEGWVRVTDAPSWGRLFDFGSNSPGGDNGELLGLGDDNGGGAEGLDYFIVSATNGTSTTARRLEIRNEDPAGGGVTTIDWAPDNFDQDFHYVTTWNEKTGDIQHFEDGELVAEGNSGILISDINDVNNWLARSNWTGDQTGAMIYNEFRIYNGAMDSNQVIASMANGPDSAPGGDPDPDKDGLPTFYENQFAFLDPFNAADAALDQDDDGLTNLGEFQKGTDPTKADTDGDGVTDGAEVNRVAGGNPAPTDPLKPDTDKDGLLDSVETGTGVFVSATDTGTDPLNDDTDGDRLNDSLETSLGSDPNNPASVPPATFPELVHRYDFGQTDGTNVPDVIGGADGTVKGEGFEWAAGTLALQGGPSDFAAYVDLPNGILSRNGAANGGSGAVSLEGWVRVTDTPAWGRIFDFGSTEPGGEDGEVDDVGGGGAGLDYFMISATIGTDAGNRRLEIRDEDPPGGGVFTRDWSILNFDKPFHFATTWNETTGEVHHYEDGEERVSATTSMLISNVNDVNNWLARSNWTGDQTAAIVFDEFRVYSGELNKVAVLENLRNGPDKAPGGGVLFQIEVFTIQDNPNGSFNVTLVFSSLPGRRYAIDSSDTLENLWEEIADGVESQGTMTTFEHQNVPAGTRVLYYRVKEE